VSKTSNPIKIAMNGTSSKIVKNNSKAVTRKEVYAVQLASFSHLNNAQSLVNRLRAKGYKANYTKTANNRGAVYKVFAGNSPRKLDVLKLKTQLATAMQINGFVVNTGVS
jgi:DedD protein